MSGIIGTSFDSNNQYHRNLPGADKAFNIIDRGDRFERNYKYDGVNTTTLSCGSKIYETTEGGRKVTVSVSPDGRVSYRKE